MAISYQAYLGLGSNQGRREAVLQLAVAQLEQHEAIARTGLSSLYETEPWGEVSQPAFINAVLGIRTSMTPGSLLAWCQKVEHQLGRRRDGTRWGPRVIDIDILWIDGPAISEPGLVVPHPLAHERAFVLVPLLELAPDLCLGSAGPASTCLESIGREGVKRCSDVASTQ